MSKLLTNPDAFIHELMQQENWFSIETAELLDAADPLNHTASLFAIDKLIPFAGHSLGPLFMPALQKIEETAAWQKHLHQGHFAYADPEENLIGNWFDCDRQASSMQAAKNLLGFADDDEFIFTGSGLSQNLSMLVDTFFRPGKKDWDTGKTKIAILDTEFFSDQAIMASVLRRAIQNAENFGCFLHQEKPDPESQILRIKPNEKGLYSIENIIQTIKDNAQYIQLISLSDIVFNTGQRLDLNTILSELESVIKENNIIVGLDLAHTIGNRPINLSALPVTFAVGCGYKHLSGFAGSALGFYVNKNADLNKYPPLQGWKAADGQRVFATISHYDASIMQNKAAVAFRASNPAPVALLSAQAFLTYFNQIGFDKCFNKSECLTRYLIAQLKYYLADKIEMITPEHPKQRGAMIAFRVKNLSKASVIEDILKHQPSEFGNFEIDVRPPNNIRLTAHYAYTKFAQINRMIQKLDMAIKVALSEN